MELEALPYELRELDETVTVTPLVVVPAGELDLVTENPHETGIEY
jgi:hypothetical protein